MEAVLPVPTPGPLDPAPVTYVNYYGRSKPRWQWFIADNIGPVIDPRPFTLPFGDGDVGSGGEGDGFGDRRCACFEALRRGRIGRALESDAVDHGTTAFPRGHGVEQVGTRPQRSDAGRPVELVA